MEKNFCILHYNGIYIIYSIIRVRFELNKAKEQKEYKK